jgi:uncharacterized protein YdhG (YjbR/CyaY superfamily)
MVVNLVKLILELYPHADVSMKFKMPTFSVGDGWVAVANQKHYVSLYTCGFSHIESFTRKYPEIKTGKGCINFRESQALPLNDIKQVIKHAISKPGAMHS